jgi:NADH dehydrogenase [ubiquinone] 1 alpha subcomplex assembly factor 7
MTALGDLLIRRIAATGPMTLADYMAECLLHPEHGYYTTREPFGTAGDFTTAPEISQMFGEMIGLALAQSWLDQGAPSPFTLAEIGPGRGTLMADILRATRAVPGFLAAARVTLVEASPRLRALQRETLGAQAVTWAEDVAALPEAPLFLIANEFFDALPIRQFTRTQAGWCETMVGVSDGKLCLGAGPSARLGLLEHRLQDTAPGEIVEVCPAAPAIIGAIAARIAACGGAAIMIDYGDWRSRGDTFQAMAGHGFTDPLAAPGQADLTAHVDFEALALAAAGCRVSPLVPQGVLLERLGITDRARHLARRMADDSLRAHIAAHRRLTHPEEMGTLFKALALFAPQAAPPPGFE